MVEYSKIDDDKLIVYQEKGFGKVGYNTYQFIIYKDYSVNIDMVMENEMNSYSISSKRELLDEGESELIDTFIINVLEPKKKEICSLNRDLIEKYENTSLFFQDIVIQDDEKVFRKFNKLKDMLQVDHPSISCECVFGMFSNLEDTVMNKNYRVK